MTRESTNMSPGDFRDPMRGAFRRAFSFPAFSMAELMVAVVILGIGLLITTSMFPIAWLKARDVAESTNVSTVALTADTYAKMLLRVNGPRSVHSLDKSVSSFFPGDWFALPSSSSNPDNEAGIYPDQRVHLLNTGNYGVGFAVSEVDWLDAAGTNQVPVAENAWRIEESMESFVTDFVMRPALANSGAHKAVITPHVRMIPPIEERPDPNDVNTTPEQLSLWNEQFETRRHCWAVFYRMAEMPGPSLKLQAGCDAGVSADCAAAEAEARSLHKQLRITMYYVTLKRPGNARFARQRGNDANATSLDVTMPRAMPPSNDVLLPTPWRFEASITAATLPIDGAQPQTGIPTEIEVNDSVIANMVQEGSFIIDDRNGEVFNVSAIKETGTLGRAILVLSKEYRAGDLYNIPDYDPGAGQQANYFNAAEFARTGLAMEGEPEQRFYWVFPPPVDNSDTVRTGGVPLFDGPQPVVGIEVRQLTIAPSLGS